MVFFAFYIRQARFKVKVHQLRSTALQHWLLHVKISLHFGCRTAEHHLFLCLLRVFIWTHGTLVEEWVFGIHWIQKSLSTKASLARRSWSIELWWDFKGAAGGAWSIYAHYLCGLCPCSSPPRAGHPLLRYCSPPSQCSRPVPGAPGAAAGPWPPDEA